MRAASRGLSQLNHVLHRLLTPRHPPYALSSLTKNIATVLECSDVTTPFPSFLCNCQRAGTVFCLLCPSGDNRDRTGDLRLAKPALSQLSYIPRLQMVGLSGIEPLTSRLSGVRSNHLSYRPCTFKNMTACTPCAGQDDLEFHSLFRKEVIQPHLPVRLPCYDLARIASSTLGASLPCGLGPRLQASPAFLA